MKRPHEIIESRRQRQYGQALHSLSGRFRHQSQSTNVSDIFGILEKKWGKELPLLLRQGMHYCVDTPHRANVVFLREHRDAPENKVAQEVAEYLRAHHPRFPLDPTEVQMEMKLLCEIVGAATKGQRVPAVAKYVFEQLREALDATFELSTKHPTVEKRKGSYVVVADEALDDFFRHINTKARLGSVLESEMSVFAGHRHEEAIEHARLLDARPSPRVQDLFRKSDRGHHGR